MKTCKDCIHSGVCGQYLLPFERDKVEEHCESFKDKSKFIELPCSTGDITYAIASEENSEIIQVQVSMMEIQPTYYRIWIQDTEDHDGVWWITDNLYNELANFTTREEAQKKLEEMNNEKERTQNDSKRSD